MKLQHVYGGKTVPKMLRLENSEMLKVTSCEAITRTIEENKHIEIDREVYGKLEIKNELKCHLISFGLIKISLY